MLAETNMGYLFSHRLVCIPQYDEQHKEYFKVFPLIPFFTVTKNGAVCKTQNSVLTFHEEEDGQKKKKKRIESSETFAPNRFIMSFCGLQSTSLRRNSHYIRGGGICGL